MSVGVAKPLWIRPCKWFEYHTLIFKLNVTSRRVLILLERNCYPNKSTSKFFFKNFPCKCYAKTKGDKLRILRKQFFFNRHKCNSLKTSNIKHCCTLCPHHEREVKGFRVLLYLHSQGNFKKA